MSSIKQDIEKLKQAKKEIDGMFDDLIGEAERLPESGKKHFLINHAFSKINDLKVRLRVILWAIISE